MDIRAIDLFCGAGGLTRGLLNAGIDVRLGVDVDPACRYPYETNNGVTFLEKDVRSFRADEIKKYLRGGDVSMLAGCAPCQAFSTYNARRAHKIPNKYALVREFARIVAEVMPDIVTMENVPYLVGRPAFRDFLNTLNKGKYHCWYEIVDVRHYGVPQTRRRLVFLASRLGAIKIVAPTHPSEKQWRSVRQTIANLPPLHAGQQDSRDPVHIASRLSGLNLERLKASKPGRTWRDWPKHLRADCHERKKGERYISVYGRMSWDKPAPTITTQCFGFGNGRFGHPGQMRGISLREAALLQTFPRSYEFLPKDEKIRIGEIGCLIGNAVPVRLAEAIGRSIVRSVKSK
jgi:DNA (cytosine-5)-methyltransferase 1